MSNSPKMSLSKGVSALFVHMCTLSPELPCQVSLISPRRVLLGYEDRVQVCAVGDDRLSLLYEFRGSCVKVAGHSAVLLRHPQAYCFLDLRRFTRLSATRIRDSLYSKDGRLFCAERRMAYYLTEQLSIRGVDRGRRKPTFVRDVGLLLAKFLQANHRDLGLADLRLAGMLVRGLGEQELAVFWGALECVPFVCVFFKKAISFKLVAFELMGTYLKRILEVRLLPSGAVARRTPRPGADGDLVFAFASSRKLTVMLLREAYADSVCSELHLPGCYLDYLFNSEL